MEQIKQYLQKRIYLTALHNGDIKTIKQLMKDGFNIDCKLYCRPLSYNHVNNTHVSRFTKSPFEISIYIRNNYKLTKFLLQYCKDLKNILFYAFGLDTDYKLVKLLYKYKASSNDINMYLQAPLHLYIEEIRNIDEFEYIYEQYVLRNQYKKIKLLIKHGANLNKRHTYFYNRGHIRYINITYINQVFIHLYHTAQVNNSCNYVYHKIIKLLIKNGCSVDRLHEYKQYKLYLHDNKLIYIFKN